MALDQSALLELLDALKSADADDVVRRSLEAVFQASIEAEATARIGANRSSGPRPAPRSATGIGIGWSRPRPETSSCGSRSCAPGRSSRRCWSGGGASIRRCSRW
jgi:hypothetical protein